MPSTNKTSYLSLNSWIGEDKPKRDDFNSDNEIIDTAIKTHHEDATSHITSKERTAWNNCVPLISNYIGDGTHPREIDIGFMPSLVIVMASDATFGQYSFDTNDTTVTCAIATRLTATSGLSITSNGFSVSQYPMTHPNGRYVRLNTQNEIFSYVAFR